MGPCVGGWNAEHLETAENPLHPPQILFQHPRLRENQNVQPLVQRILPQLGGTPNQFFGYIETRDSQKLPAAEASRFIKFLTRPPHGPKGHRNPPLQISGHVNCFLQAQAPIPLVRGPLNTLDQSQTYHEPHREPLASHRGPGPAARGRAQNSRTSSAKHRTFASKLNAAPPMLEGPDHQAPLSLAHD